MRIRLENNICVVITAVTLMGVPAAQAQRVTVAVEITDSVAHRVFQGAFSQALRSVGDVDVVTLGEHPDYVISGVVLCEPVSCENPVAYSAALRFWSPIGKEVAGWIADRAIPKTPKATYYHRWDSVTTNVIWPIIEGYEMTHTSWVVEWGRDRYEQSIRELVRQLDSDCFERSRMWQRAFAASDSSVTRAIEQSITARTWIC